MNLIFLIKIRFIRFISKISVLLNNLAKLAP